MKEIKKTEQAGKGFYELVSESDMFSRLDSIVNETERIDALEMFALRGVVSEAVDQTPDPKEYDGAFYLLETLRNDARRKLGVFAEDFNRAYRACNEAIERREYRNGYGEERSIHIRGDNGNSPSEQENALQLD